MLRQQDNKVEEKIAQVSVGSLGHPRKDGWNSLPPRGKETPWKLLGTLLLLEVKEGGGFYSDEMILGSMVVSMGAGLLKKTQKWQKGMGKIQPASPGHTDPTRKVQGPGV